jgi:phosphatidylserine/phosphatidylglycerophosphate/cardiolipin synthase-like enzyme
VQLEGPITHDLEKEFAWRWNRERGDSKRAPLPGWSAFDDITLTPPAIVEQNLGFYPTAVQMLRTVSESTGDDPSAFFATRRNDIREAYRHGIACAERFIYLENQYFRVPEMADWIVARGAVQPDLFVIVVVVDGAMVTKDDGANPITDQGLHLQLDMFDRLVKGLGADRVRFYTMDRRYVHAKLILVDDLLCCIGSANVNPRSFGVDSELNVQLREHDPDVIAGFRKALWAHNLGVDAATVDNWSTSDFIAQWDDVAKKNAAKASTPDKMRGEGILRFDYTRFPGREWPIPDGLVDVGITSDGDQQIASTDEPAPDGGDAPAALGAAFRPRRGFTS